MTTSSAALKALLDATVAPRLQTFGFRRKRNEWTREAGLAIQCIGTQPLSTGGVFTVHVAVQFPTVDDIDGNQFHPSRAMHMGPGQRLGFLMPTPGDWWWPVDDLDAGAQVADALERYGLPWLERHSDLRTVATDVINGHHRAAMWIVLGEPDRARQFLVELRQELKDDRLPSLHGFYEAEITRTQGVLERAGLNA